MTLSVVNNIAYYLQRSARCFPDHPAIAVGEKTVRTYSQMALRVQGLSDYLVGKFRPGSQIAIVSPNCPEYLEALFAIWHAGMVAVPINAKLHAREIEKIVINDSETVMTFSHSSLSVPGWGYDLDGESFDKWASKLEGGRALLPEPTVPDALAWIFYTSGTTGRSKGAMLTHGNLLAMCQAFLIDVVSVEPGDAMIHACQLSHGSGLYALPHVVKAGVNVITHAGRFDANDVAGLLHSWKLNGQSTFGPPTVLNRVVSAWGAHCYDDYRRPKALIFGGSPLYQTDRQRAMDCFPGSVAQIYGQGESPCTITAISPRMYLNMGVSDRFNSVGVAQYGMQVKIAGGTDDPQRGEVLVRGPAVMKGYWNNSGATGTALKDGWLHTGDIGHMDGDGFLWLHDRKNDMIISGGFNVYPREVEEVLLKHPQIREVSVIGEPDAEWGEKVVAYVVPDAPRMQSGPVRVRLGDMGSPLAVDAMDALCLANIARFKRPREYVIVDQLPKGDTDKVSKRMLREMANG